MNRKKGLRWSPTLQQSRMPIVVFLILFNLKNSKQSITRHFGDKDEATQIQIHLPSRPIYLEPAKSTQSTFPSPQNSSIPINTKTNKSD